MPSRILQTPLSQEDADAEGNVEGDFEGEGEGEGEGLLFSCRCESARPVATLLSCLRNVNSNASLALTHGAGGGPSLTALQDATSSILTQRSSRGGSSGSMSYGGGGGGGGIGIGGGGGSKGNKIQYCTVFCTERGLTFQVYGVGKQSRATVEIQRGLFSEYYVKEERVVIEDDDDDGNGDGDGNAQVEIIKGGEFGINLTTVLGCMMVLGPSSLDRTTLCLSYDLSTAIFKVELLEDAMNTTGGPMGGCVISNCAIPGLSVSDEATSYIKDEEDGNDDDDELLLGNEHTSGLEYAFRSVPTVARARLRSDFLKDAVEEMTTCAGAVMATIGISRRGLELATFGHSTECHVVLPFVGNHPDIFVSLEGVGIGKGKGSGTRTGSDRNNRNGTSQDFHARSYPLHSILSAMRGLEIATETCINMNQNGMVAIQHKVLDKVGNGDENYVEFIMGCLRNDEEEEGGEEEGTFNGLMIGNERQQTSTDFSQSQQSATQTIPHDFTPPRNIGNANDDERERDHIDEIRHRHQNQESQTCHRQNHRQKEKQSKMSASASDSANSTESEDDVNIQRSRRRRRRPQALSAEQEKDDTKRERSRQQLLAARRRQAATKYNNDEDDCTTDDDTNANAINEYTANASAQSHKNHPEKDREEDQDNNGDSSETEDEHLQEESQQSAASALFGAVATTATNRRRENNANRRRSTHNSIMIGLQRDDDEGDDDEDDESSSDEEFEFEESLDVTTSTVNMSRLNDGPVGGLSPQLMYGDTHLEEDDE